MAEQLAMLNCSVLVCCCRCALGRAQASIGERATFSAAAKIVVDAGAIFRDAENVAREVEMIYSRHSTLFQASQALEHYFATGIVTSSEHPFIRYRRNRFEVVFPL
jgi:hypothetical protein